jgi:U4/U6 small nuclear ribonucleoprotein PRP4
MNFSQSTFNTITRHENLVKEAENQKSKKYEAPTDDEAVKNALKRLKEPISLPGEDSTSRRERLQHLMTKTQNEDTMEEDQEEEEEEEEEFFTEGPEFLGRIRKFLATYSLERSSKRISKQKKMKINLDSFDFDDEKNIKEKLDYIQMKQRFVHTSSQIGDNRPVNCIQFLDSKNQIISGSWSGVIKLWNSTTLENQMTFKGHLGKMVTGLASNPIENSNVSFASGGADSALKLWNISKETPLSTLTGHTARLGRIAFHPSGKFVGSPSYDLTWRFWDLETNQCLFEQEGHSSAVYCLSFQCDGSLVTSCDLGGIGRVWDLRTGRTITTLTGHCKQILSCDFSPNGFEIATGSDDRTVKIWDLRQRKTLYTLPAHSKLISVVKYEKKSGKFLMTGSFDKTCKLWSCTEFKLIKTLKGHEERIMDADISLDEEKIVSTGWDKSWKLWSLQDDYLDLDF